MKSAKQLTVNRELDNPSSYSFSGLSRRSKITVTPINGTHFSTPSRGVSKFTKLFPAEETQEIISNLLTFKCRNRHKEP